MSIIEKTIQVDVPRRTAYDQWTQFEEFPAFMEGVQRVKQIDDKRLHWTGEIAGVKREWDAEIVEQKPDELVAWCSTDGAKNDGAVSFAPLGVDATQVTLRMEFEPEGAAEKAADFLHLVDLQVSKDLGTFKKFIEGRGAETGSWRGDIEPTGEVHPDPDEDLI